MYTWSVCFFSVYKFQGSLHNQDVSRTLALWLQIVVCNTVMGCYVINTTQRWGLTTQALLSSATPDSIQRYPHIALYPWGKLNTRLSSGGTQVLSWIITEICNKMWENDWSDSTVLLWGIALRVNVKGCRLHIFKEHKLWSVFQGLSKDQKPWDIKSKFWNGTYPLSTTPRILKITMRILRISKTLSDGYDK